MHLSLVKGGLPYLKEEYVSPENIILMNNGPFLRSVLPICIHISTATYLRNFALRLHRDEVIIDSPAKREAVALLLKGSISKITLPVAECQLESDAAAQEAINTSMAVLVPCIETECVNAASSWVVRLLNRAGLTVRDSYLHATRVLLRLLSSLIERLGALSVSPFQVCISELQGAASSAILAYLMGFKPSANSMAPFHTIWQMTGGLDASLRAYVLLSSCCVNKLTESAG